MRPLAAVERLFERLLERPATRLARSGLRSVQVRHALERAMEDHRRPVAGKVLVPWRYAIHVAPGDLEGLSADPSALAGELADGALAFARGHGYLLDARPRISLTPDPRLGVGQIRVDAAFDADGAEEQQEPPAAGSHADPTRTSVYPVPRSAGPLALVREIRADGRGRRWTIDAGSLTIGRAADNAIVLLDGRVSRHHATIRTRHGAVVLTDLGSTNGSRVNGARIDEAALGIGDRIEIGSAILLVEAG